jgi:hypothetical protein
VEEQGAWHVDFEDLNGRAGGSQQLRVTVHNPARDNGNNGIDVYHVSRVQFVSDGNRFYYLRLYENGLGPETRVADDAWLLGAEVSVSHDDGSTPVSSAIARARAGMLVFDQQQVFATRSLWRTLGWQLGFLNPLLLQAEPIEGAAAGRAPPPPQPEPAAEPEELARMGLALGSALSAPGANPYLVCRTDICAQTDPRHPCVS